MTTGFIGIAWSVSEKTLERIEGKLADSFYQDFHRNNNLTDQMLIELFLLS